MPNPEDEVQPGCASEPFLDLKENGKVDDAGEKSDAETRNEIANHNEENDDLLGLKSWCEKKVPLAGQLLTLCAALVFTLSACLVKSVKEVDPFLLASLRNVFIFFFSAPFVIRNRVDLYPEGKRLQLIIKTVCGTFNLSLMYYSFRHLPIGDCRMISSSAPIFVTVLARIFLHEPCGLFDVFNVLFTTIGIVFVMQPPFVFGNLVEDEDSFEYQSQHFVVAVMALIGTLFSAASMAVTRSLKDVDAFLITGWNGLFGSVPPLIVSYFTGGLAVPSLEDRAYVLLLSFVSFWGQMLMTWALQIDEAGQISLARKAEDILLGFLVQIVYFGENPSWLTLLGAVIVSTGVILGGFRKIAMFKVRNEIMRNFLCLPKFREKVCDIVTDGAKA